MILSKLCRGRGKGNDTAAPHKSGLPVSHLLVFIPQGESQQPMLLRGHQLNHIIKSGEAEDIMYPSRE